jgi:hypothetical protein
MIVGGRREPWRRIAAAGDNGSPSAARAAFLTSLQDSISTIGERSPSEGYGLLAPEPRGDPDGGTGGAA